MRLVPLALSVLISLPAIAQTERAIYPDDYTPSACASNDPCPSFEASQMKGAAASFLGLNLDHTWIEKHLDEMKSDLAPLCKKRGTCFAHPSNTFTFCDDVMMAEARPICDRRYKDKYDHEQCRITLEVYLLGVEQHATPLWRKAQECAKTQPQPAHTKPLDIWMTPAAIPFGYGGYVTFYALDPDTHVPVFANITFEGQRLFAPSNPVGAPAAYYPFKIPFKMIRVPNASGHTDLVPPNVTVAAAGYPSSTFRLASSVPKVLVELEPKSLHAGANRFVVRARDAETGKPVELRIMADETPIGSSNEPITITLPKRGWPEIWATSLFNRYSDVVVLPSPKK